MPNRSINGAAGGTTAVLDADPDLRDALEGPRLARALDAAVAPSRSFGPGPCDLSDLLGEDSLGYGLLVISGLLVCELRVAATRGIEFLGPGDLVQRPSPAVAAGPVQRRSNAAGCWRSAPAARSSSATARPRRRRTRTTSSDAPPAAPAPARGAGRDQRRSRAAGPPWRAGVAHRGVGDVRSSPTH